MNSFIDSFSEDLFSESKIDKMLSLSSTNSDDSTVVLDYLKEIRDELYNFLNSQKNPQIVLTALVKSAEILYGKYFENIQIHLILGDFVHVTIEKIIYGDRKWNKESKYSFKQWVYLCLLSIIRNEYKKFKNKKNIPLNDDDIFNTQKEEALSTTEFDESCFSDCSDEIKNIGYDFNFNEENNDFILKGTEVINSIYNELKHSNKQSDIIEFSLLEHYLKYKKWDIKKVAKKLNVTNNVLENAVKRIKRKIINHLKDWK